MLFLDVIGTEARRLPGRFQTLWKEMLFVAIVLVALAAIVYGADWTTSRTDENTSVPFVVPVFQQPEPAVQQVQPVVPAIHQPAAQAVQQVPAVVAPAAPAPTVVDYRVAWTEVKGFDPFTIPVEEGFYDGYITYSSVKGRYAERILPHLKELPVAVAVARDEIDKNTVLVALGADRYGPYILLSVDGETSWCMLNLLPRERGRDAVSVRVTVRGEKIHLYGQDPRPGNHWWEAVVKKTSLPCS